MAKQYGPAIEGNIMSFLLMNYEKISAKSFWGNFADIYVKIYTSKPGQEVCEELSKEFEGQAEVWETERDPGLIENDTEIGVEIMVKYL
jgi:hypothetical protein